jgi:hypothetical protein
VELLYGAQGRGKEKIMIEHQTNYKHNICEGRGYSGMYRKLLKNVWWRDGVSEYNGKT